MTQPATDSKNTINQAFLDTVERRGGYPALKSKIDGTYQPTTYDQLADHVKNFSLGLRELGLNFGDRVAMLAENSQKWAIADLGILSLGAVNVPMFYTSTSKQVSYIVQDSGSKIICVSTKRQLEKVRAFFDLKTSEGFIITGFKLVEGINGMFVGFPSQKDEKSEQV